jgi:hypothetical protein
MVAQPSIRSGVRGITDVVRKATSPTESEWDRAIERAKQELASNPPKKGERVFMSSSRNYRFQITAPMTTYDPLTQQAVAKEPKAAVFERYIYRTNDPIVVRKITNDRFYGSEMFDATEIIRKHQAQSADALVEQVMQAPEELRESVANRLIATLGTAPGKTSAALPQRVPGDPEEPVEK